MNQIESKANLQEKRRKISKKCEDVIFVCPDAFLSVLAEIYSKKRIQRNENKTKKKMPKQKWYKNSLNCSVGNFQNRKIAAQSRRCLAKQRMNFETISR